MTNARNKGATGERKFCKWLEDNLNIKAERNLEQVRSGGNDIVEDSGLFSFEVKRVEGLDIQSAWIQCKHDSEINNLIPVLAFRANRERWKFAISASHIGIELSYIILPEHVFVAWANNLIINNLDLSC